MISLCPRGLGLLRSAVAAFVFVFVFVFAFARPARAGVTDEPEDERPRVVDPGVSIGPAIAYGERPSFAREVRACSARFAICVHASSRRDGAAATAALRAFERAWETLTGALALPTPDVDPTTLAYDVFLADDASALGNAELARTELEARDVRSRFDRGRSFTLLDRRFHAGCALDTIAARSIARASLYRVAPATEEATALAQSAYLAELAVPCSTALVADEVAAFQSRSFSSLADAHAGDDAAVLPSPLALAFAHAGGPPRLAALYAAGGAAFWARLDWAFGRVPGGIVTASWALHPTTTRVSDGADGDAVRWANVPDTFDVLRTTFKGALSTGGTVADLWLDFAVARAFLGSADDGLHLPELRTLGSAAAVTPDWDIPWPKAPRRLAAHQPVAPTGASYLVVRHVGAAPGARLRVEIEWEEHALFRWAFVKLDAAGRELGRVLIPTTERATTAQMTLVDLEGVDRVMLVGVNVGDPAYGYNPDDEVWEPHGWLVTIAED